MQLARQKWLPTYQGGGYHAGTFIAHRDNDPCHPTLAAEQMAKSGSFITASSFKGIEQAQQTGGHTLSHGVVYGIVTEDNPLHIKTANCPYISEVSGDTVSLVGKCAWTDGEDHIFTDWNTTFLASKGLANGAQTFTGGSGKFSGIQGSNPFQCQ
jgi:hypothetical protein